MTELRIAGVHAEALHAHLFPGDGKEAVAFALCGRHRGAEGDVLLVQDVVPIPLADCPVREPDRITWRTEALEPVLDRAARARLGVVKVHSHPTGWPRFSAVDDASDADLFPSVNGWVDDDGPHASVVMLPDGRLFGRIVDAAGAFTPVSRILVVGDDLAVHDEASFRVVPAHAARHAQLFGSATTAILGGLRVGVVGCSGTGSVVVEQLARLGVRRLVLIDPDHVEERNLNRMVGSTRDDAVRRAKKVDVLARWVERMGLGTEVVPLALNLVSREAVAALAGCDVVFGCMDSHDGRRVLNRVATFYLLPYVDVGVSLEADGKGGVDQVCVAAHYLQPGRSSLLSRGAIRQKVADAEALKRGDPATYERLRADKYIEGANEDQPAVISVNMLAAGLGVNELLARVHPFRDAANAFSASTRFSLSQLELYLDPEGAPCHSLTRGLGRGDVEPPLDMPELSRGSAPRGRAA